MPRKESHFRRIALRLERFSLVLNSIRLRPYQLEPFNAIWESIRNRRGDSFVLIFSRQSGKDELIANLIAFLFYRLHHHEISIVCALPTFTPQAVQAMQRLNARLSRPWFKEKKKFFGGQYFHYGRARCTYLSAEPTANVVGATARTLLIILNEAQDIHPSVYDKKFAPMAASGNATRLFAGTSWTSDNLLARELRSARQAEKLDGRRRVFIVTGEEAGRVNPRYAVFMKGELAKFVRDHPLIRTQYFCEEIDAQVSLFNPGRMALLQSDEPALDSPPAVESQNGGNKRVVAFLLDLAGQDEARMDLSAEAPLANPGRDSVTLSIVSVDLSTLETLQAPTFRVVSRKQWTGLNHLLVFGQVKALGDAWKPQHFVVDATGVGEGFWALLERSFPGRVIPVKFSQQVKSELGWRFLAIIETGRFKACSFPEAARRQYLGCESDVLAGPGRRLRWGVPEGRRGAGRRTAPR
jgi:hypothetical protein